MSRWGFWVFGVLMWGSSSGMAQRALPPEVLVFPDWILHNGFVLVADSDRPPIRTAQAVAVRGNRVLVVGESARVLAMRGPDTEVIDLRGKAVMPGVIDTHSHPNRVALQDYQEDIPLEIRRRFYPLEVDYDVQSKAELLENIATAVQNAPPERRWLAAQAPTQMQFTEAWRSLRRQDLDAITSDRPLLVIWRTFGPVNSKAIEVLTSKFGAGLPGIVRDEKGQPTGWIEGIAAWVAYADMRPSLAPEYLAQAYQKELEEWVAVGVTTLSTRLSGHEVSAMALLARNDRLPLRMAFSHDGVGRRNPLLDWYLGRLGNLQDFGIDDRIWFVGLSVGSPDAEPAGGLVASRAPKQNPLPTDVTGQDSVLFWDFEGDPSAEHIQIANRHGYRVTGVHTFGDLGYESMLEAYQKTQLAGDRAVGTYPPFTLDHLMMVSPAVLGGIRALTEGGSLKNLVLSIQSPLFFGSPGTLVREVYGEEVFWNWLQPTRSLLDAGAILSYGADINQDPYRHPMHSLQVIVTRVNQEGAAVNPAEGLTREEGLLMLTRWGGLYVGRDDLGSLAAGNLADLLILDRNPLDPEVPEDDISEIQVLMTMLDGSVAYLSPDLQF